MVQGHFSIVLCLYPRLDGNSSPELRRYLSGDDSQIDVMFLMLLTVINFVYMSYE